MENSLWRTNKDITEVYNRHVNTIYKICFMYMKNPQDTEDAVQNTFIKFMEHKGDFSCVEHEKAWLIVTASNICKNLLRHWWRKTVDISVLADNADDTDLTVDDTLSKVLALPAKYKTVIYLYYYEGYSTVEIARILNRNESTIRSHLHIGRKLLKNLLGGECNE